MFHALASSNADCLIGTPNDSLSEHAWSRLYRGLNHDTAKRNLQQDQSLFSPAIRHFADTFAQLQDQRHLADYEHSKVFTLSESLTWIDQAEDAIRNFMQTSAQERKMVAIQSLIRRRGRLKSERP